MAGTYELTVTDASGCTGSSSVTVIETVIDPVDITGGPDYCSGQTLDLIATTGFDTYLCPTDWVLK